MFLATSIGLSVRKDIRFEKDEYSLPFFRMFVIFEILGPPLSSYIITSG